MAEFYFDTSDCDLSMFGDWTESELMELGICSEHSFNLEDFLSDGVIPEIEVQHEEDSFDPEAFFDAAFPERKQNNLVQEPHADGSIVPKEILEPWNDWEEELERVCIPLEIVEEWGTLEEFAESVDGTGFNQSGGGVEGEPAPKRRRYECGECGKSFTRTNDLKHHQTSHTKEKPFECDVCGKHFGTKKNLNRHKKIHEKINLTRVHL